MSHDVPSDMEILCEIGRNLVEAVNRVAAAYERMVGLAEAKQQRSPAAANGGEGEAPRKKPKGDVLTVTDHVVSFGIVTDRGGNPKTTKKGANYWRLKLAGGFEAMVFSESQGKRLAKAYEEGLTVIIEYTTDGKYNNIESVTLGKGGTPRPAQQEPALPGCGHSPDNCDCAF